MSAVSFQHLREFVAVVVLFAEAEIAVAVGADAEQLVAAVVRAAPRALSSALHRAEADLVVVQYGHHRASSPPPEVG